MLKRVFKDTIPVLTGYMVLGFGFGIIASVTVVVLYVIKRNTLVSIVAGTLLYMFLVQFIF